MKADIKLNMPIISVVIPHLNQSAELAACLASLQNQELDRTLYELIVVDNGSTVPPYDVIASFAGAKLVIETQPGPGPARNAGIRAARADLIAFLDADCRADHAWLSTALRVLST